MSVHNQFGRLSPPPFYHHSPHSDNAPPTSLSFMLSPLAPPANPYPSPNDMKVADDTYYMAKYKDMKRKVKEIELDNDKLHLKCLKARKNIQRLRLERAILYERLSSISPTDSNAFPTVAVQRSGTGPYPSPDPPQGQEHQPPFSPDIQARLHADQSRVHSEAPYQARSQHPQSSIPGADPPQRSFEDPVIAYHQPRIPSCGPECHPPKQRQRKLKLGPNGEPDPQQVRNGGTSPHRVFPFVHEYSNTQEQSERPLPTHPPPVYPSEIRFHQYEASSERRPVNRNKRDMDRDTEKQNKHAGKRRPSQEMDRDQRRHLRSRSRSPTAHASPHYAYHMQYSFTSSERDSRPSQNDNSDRQSTDQHSDKSSQRHAVESRGRNTREAEAASYNTRYQDHQASVERNEVRNNHRKLRPEKKKKCVQSQMDYDMLHARDREERDDCDRGYRGLPRRVSGVDDVNGLPRVREGEVMD